MMTRLRTSSSAVLRHAVLSLALGTALGAAGAGPDQTPREQERRSRQPEEVERANQRAFEAFAAEVAEVERDLTELQKELSAYEKRIEALMTNEEGKRIAASRECVADFARLEADLPVGPSELLRRSKAIESLKADLAKELQRERVGYLPSPERLNEVRDAKRWAVSSLERVRKSSAALDGILQAAPKEQGGGKTLDLALKNHQAEHIARELAARRAGESAAAPAVDEMMRDTARITALEAANARFERELRETRAEILRIRAESEEALAQAERTHRERLRAIERNKEDEEVMVHGEEVDRRVKNAAQRAEADKTLLRQKARDPEVRRLLAPLLAKGYWQPGDFPWSPKSIEEKPISLSQLRKHGALERTRTGLNKLHDVGAVTHGNQDRPVKWSYHHHAQRLTATQVAELKRAQDLLIELGDVLVEEGLLSP